MKVTSVVRNARSRMKPMRYPFTAPKAAPVATAARNPTHTGKSKMNTLDTAAKVASAKMEPTERSMPPASITMVRPVTTIENSPSWRVDSTSAVGLKKP